MSPECGDMVSCYKHIDETTCSYWACFDDLSGLDEEILAEEEIHLPPEVDFCATIDFWWGDFLSELME